MHKYFDMSTIDVQTEKYNHFKSILSERDSRLIFAAEAKSLGRGGINLVSKITGISRSTLTIGIKELENDLALVSGQKVKIRKAGGGRKKETSKNEKLEKIIEDIVSPYTMGDPMKPLLWSSKSLRKIAAIALQKDIVISHETVAKILKGLRYSLQGNRKTDEGSSHEDRDAQFEYINKIAQEFLAANSPVISVDCKKKEVLGNLKNAGQDWFPNGQPTHVKVYDFVDKELGKAIPYGVYDLANNEGWVSVGISHDTASFAVATIRSWWYEMGQERFNGNQLFITADGGGSNSSRSRLWKKELQVLSNETGLEITVSHYPPGTSKWNKIEHRLFCYITANWKAKPLINIQVVVDLIGSTTTTTGLRVKSKIDNATYQTGIKVADEELEKIRITRDVFHGEWNYVIKPNIV